MTFSYNPLDPMNQSMYMEERYPNTIEEHCRAAHSYPTANIDGATIPQQPTKDSWYYNQDNKDDGHISFFEKAKAFVKGGTYNLVHGMFCDNNGFSWKRTLLTAGAATAVALTGSIGLAVAGGIGLLSAADNLIHSAKEAKNAKTDQEAREAYEGIGEGTTTAALSLWAGWKGLKGLKAKYFSKPKPTTPPPSNPTTPTGTTPTGSTPTPSTPTGTTPTGSTPPPSTPTGTTPTGSTPTHQPQGVGGLPAVINRPEINLPPIEEFLPHEQQFNLPAQKPRLALPSPADVRARMIADGQFNLPATIAAEPKLNLPPIEEFLPKPEQQFNIPAQKPQLYLPLPTEAEANTVAEVVAPKTPKAPKSRKTGTTKKTTTKKTTAKKPTAKRTVKPKKADIKTRSYTDGVYNISTTPSPDVEYFYYANPTNTNPSGYGPASNYFG